MTDDDQALKNHVAAMASAATLARQRLDKGARYRAEHIELLQMIHGVAVRLIDQHFEDDNG